jgi:outer membrane lipoprotein-sorting protein
VSATTSASAAPAPVESSVPAAEDGGSASLVDAGASDARADAAAPIKDAGAPRDGGLATTPDAGAADAAVAATADAGAVPPLDVPAAGSADAVAAEIDGIFVGKNTFTARFKQEHMQKVSGATKKSSGTVVVDKPNKISFRYDPPSKNRIVSDGKELKIYVADDSQMFVQPVQNTEYPGALSFIMGRGLRPSFSFTFNEKAASTFTAGPVLHGKPRQPTPHYESVFFYVDKAKLAQKDPGVILRVLILDAQGNRNRFDFEGAAQPATVDAAEFTFTPPPGTNVTRN